MGDASRLHSWNNDRNRTSKTSGKAARVQKSAMDLGKAWSSGILIGFESDLTAVKRILSSHFKTRFSLCWIAHDRCCHCL